MKPILALTLSAIYWFAFFNPCLGELEPFHQEVKDQPIPIHSHDVNSEDDAEVIILDDAMSIARKRSEFGRKSNLPEQEKPILVDAHLPKSERLSSDDIKTGSPEITTDKPKPPVQTKPKTTKTKKVAQKPTSATSTTKKQNLDTSAAPPTEKELTTPPQEKPEISSQTTGAPTSTTPTTTTPTPTTTSEPKPIPEEMYCLCDVHVCIFFKPYKKWFGKTITSLLFLLVCILIL